MQDNGLSTYQKRIESALIFHLVINFKKHLKKQIKERLLPFIKF
ncbi:hypothetical protein PMAN_a2657 [Pseudoalteromonas marina]|nr:hypothetical protein PMAN_a2657 [Pseudoalteromonas marina]